MISSILRKLAAFLSFFFKNKPSITKKNNEILKEIYPKIANYKLKKKGLKRTHVEFNNKILKLLKEKKIQNFLRENFIQKMFFVHNRLFINHELKTLKKVLNGVFIKKY